MELVKNISLLESPNIRVSGVKDLSMAKVSNMIGKGPNYSRADTIKAKESQK